MSWNRSKYDQCAYQKELSQSTSPIYYTLDPNKFYNSHDCRPAFGLLGGNNVSVTQNNMVDVESDLMGITRPNSQCPERKFVPHCEQCSEMSGIPVHGKCKFTESLQHLPNCDIIQYDPKIDHVGYSVKYIPCSHQGDQPKMMYPPQRNPTHYNL
jgi:hypothetical protein